MMSDPRCALCGVRIEYMDPTGDGLAAWWRHEIHPADEHDARPTEEWVRADEREILAQAIEAANPDIWDPTEWDSGRMSGMDDAAHIVRNGGNRE